MTAEVDFAGRSPTEQIEQRDWDWSFPAKVHTLHVHIIVFTSLTVCSRYKRICSLRKEDTLRRVGKCPMHLDRPASASERRLREGMAATRTDDLLELQQSLIPIAVERVSRENFPFPPK
jgi:hypothetical protein